MNISKIGVVGAGAMGTGIANLAAMAGYEVVLRDVEDAVVDRAISKIDNYMRRSVEKGKLSEDERKAALGKISGTSKWADLAGVDLVIEAVVEDMEAKKQVFTALDKLCRPEVIIASNTSSMSITELAASTGRADKVCGMHFFNPAQIMRLVEIIRGLQTSDQTVETAAALAKSFGKTTVEVKKDSPGFIVNRIMIPQFIEAARLLQEGVASAEDIDTAVKLGLNYPMGPFELMDYTGIDIGYLVMEYFADEFRNNQYAAPQVIKQMVRAGKLGRKSNEGFYKY